MRASVDPGAGALAEDLAARGGEGIELAVVLGSGLGAFADALDEPRAIPFDDLARMPASRVPGHAGRLVLGRIGGVRVLVQAGRAHLYEGFSAREVARAVRAYALLGCRTIVLTNAAGGLDAARAVPHLMRIRDHVNLQGRSPLAAHEAGRGSPYDEALSHALDRAAREEHIALATGIYAGLLGPSYETPAEIKMLARFGAAAVGMSTVCEALAARAEGMRVCALSCITNHAVGISPHPLAHDEVVAASARVAGDLRRLLVRAVPLLVI